MGPPPTPSSRTWAAKSTSKDIIDGVTVQEETDNVTGLSQQVVIESKDPNKEPRISVKEEGKKSGGRAFPLPRRARTSKSRT